MENSNFGIIITGSSSGIGSGLTQHFLNKGHPVYQLDINNIEDPEKGIYQVDVTNIQQIELFFKKIEDKKIKSIINNAAIQVEKSIIDISTEEWNRVLNTNITAIHLMTKTFYKKLEGGSIVNISSVHAKSTSPNLSAYVASKGAVSALTRSMALELASYSIRVNSILPGAINTPMLEKGLSRNFSYEEAKNKLIKSTPLKKIGEPSDIAHMADFLINENLASNITGQEFIVDGGVLAKLATE